EHGGRDHHHRIDIVFAQGDQLFLDIGAAGDVEHQALHADALEFARKLFDQQRIEGVAHLRDDDAGDIAAPGGEHGGDGVGLVVELFGGAQDALAQLGGDGGAGGEGSR